MNVEWVILYRLAVLMTGASFAYMGYRLFCLGIYEKAGDLVAQWKGFSLILRQAAPGTFFAVLGVVLVGLCAWRGIIVKESNMAAVSTTVPVDRKQTSINVPEPIVKLADRITKDKVVSTNDLVELSKFVQNYITVESKIVLSHESSTAASTEALEVHLVLPQPALDQLAKAAALTDTDKTALQDFEKHVDDYLRVPADVKHIVANAVTGASIQPSDVDKLKKWAEVNSVIIVPPTPGTAYPKTQGIKTP